MGNWIDHLVVAAPSLGAGIEHVRAALGATPVFGGRHEGNGTQNALLSLRAPTYLEVLAPDPDQSVESPLLGLGAPVLYGVAIGTDDIDAAVHALRDAGVPDVSDPFEMSRRLPDGELLVWRLAMIGGGMGFARPFVISWDEGGSPADSVPSGGRFVALRAGDADPDVARRPFAALGVDVTVEHSATGWLAADIETAEGVVTLS